jgi:dTMP kinase
MVSAGFFVVVEGADGTGKSTLAAKLANHLGATLTFEPSHGPIGWWVRKNLSDLPAAALPYLFAADRAQHVTETIAPALAAGEMVVCDRYIPSSVAYQGLDAIALNTSFPLAKDDAEIRKALLERTTDSNWSVRRQLIAPAS